MVFRWNKQNGIYQMILDATDDKSDVFISKAHCHEIGIGCQYAVGSNILEVMDPWDDAVRLHYVDLKSKDCGDLAVERPISDDEQEMVVERCKQIKAVRKGLEPLVFARYDTALSPDARNYVEMALLDMMPKWFERVES